MSRATLIDERPEEEETPTTEEQVLESLEEEPTQEELELPEKYQGKSVEDLVQMHQELEKF